MKFETGEELKAIKEENIRKKKPGLLGQYGEWSWGKVPDLLEKRKIHKQEVLARQAARVKELEEREKRGELFTKLRGNPDDEEISKTD